MSAQTRAPSRAEGLVARAEGLFPGGVNSPVRAFRAVGRPPLVLERGEGAYLGDRLLGRAVHAGLLSHRGPAVARLRPGQGVHVPRAGGVARAHGAAGNDGRRVPAGPGRRGRTGRPAFRFLGRRPRPGRLRRVRPAPRPAPLRLARRRPHDPLRNRRRSPARADGRRGRRRHRHRPRLSLADAWRRVGTERGIQGNLDPARCLAGWEATQAGARAVLAEAAGRPGHIFNLGHGVLPDTDPAMLRRLVDFIHEDPGAHRRT